MKKLLDRTEKVMDDFEMYQKGESLDDPEVINRRQDVHSAWSKLQLLVEEREALIRKAISYHKTMFEVNQVLDGLESEWTKATGYINLRNIGNFWFYHLVTSNLKTFRISSIFKFLTFSDLWRQLTLIIY